jgi:putative transposase
VEGVFGDGRKASVCGSPATGEPMAELCREFGISRKTGYKTFDRYQECGVEGLTDRSRRPYRYANQLPFPVENYILNVKREHTSWGARKIRERLLRRFSGIPIPAKSTIHAVLDRYGLVERLGRVRRRAQGTALSLGQKPRAVVHRLQGRVLAGESSILLSTDRHRSL